MTRRKRRDQVRIIYQGVPLNGVVALKLRMQNSIDKRQNEILELSAIEAAKRMQRLTPFKTGVARSNWSVARDGENPPFDDSKLGRGWPVDTTGLFGIFGQGPVMIRNRTPYIIDLEFGSSRQAPNGMMRITVPELPLITKSIARSTRGKAVIKK